MININISNKQYASITILIYDLTFFRLSQTQENPAHNLQLPGGEADLTQLTVRGLTPQGAPHLHKDPHLRVQM